MADLTHGPRGRPIVESTDGERYRYVGEVREVKPPPAQPPRTRVIKSFTYEPQTRLGNFIFAMSLFIVAAITLYALAR